MTWEQFKKEVEKAGVQDGDELAWIRWDGDRTFSGVECYRPISDDSDEAAKWIIKNESY